MLLRTEVDSYGYNCEVDPEMKLKMLRNAIPFVYAELVVIPSTDV